jgi:hypothetical protein
MLMDAIPCGLKLCCLMCIACSGFFYSAGQGQELVRGVPPTTPCLDGKCLPGSVDYPAYQPKYPNPYHLKGCGCKDCNQTAAQRWKRSLQASHWGYKDYFQQNTFGDSLRSGFAANIRDGALERTTLYRMDFFPEDSPNAHMLNAKGLERLDKAIAVSQAYGRGLRVELTRTRPELNEQRASWLVENPSVVAAGISPESIVFVGNAASTSGADAIRWYQRGTASRSSPGPTSNASGFSLPITSQSGSMGPGQSNP